MSDTDHDRRRLAARLAVVERAPTARACECAHEAYEPPAHGDTAPSATELERPTTERDADADLHRTVRALCRYVLFDGVATGGDDDHRAAVREALAELPAPAPLDADPPQTDRATTADLTTNRSLAPREWLERVANAVFE